MFVFKQWNEFVENCCVFDENSYIPIQDLCSIFAHYMRENRDVPRFNYIGVAADHVDFLLKASPNMMGKIRFSPGWIKESFRIDTRLVLGLKVVRFNKKQSILPTCST